MSKYIIGYTTGVFDLFHVGHLNMLSNAKSMCDRLIVGVSTDELANYKNKKIVIPYDERIQIVKNIRHVDAVVPQESMDKFEAWKRLKFDIMFVGDDWYGNPKWETYEKQLAEVGVKIIYFPYYKGTSSTRIKEIISKLSD